MKIKEYNQCGTVGVRSLDLQLISQLNQIYPSALVEFSDLNISCGSGVHAYLQPAAKLALSAAIRDRGTRMVCNSAYRTIAQQAVLYSHYRNGRCGIVAAAKPGYSNHNSGLAIDIEDAQGWRPYLERHGWRWIGAFDPMHFDFKGKSVDLRSLSIKSFQTLWNSNNPRTPIKEDGQYGPATEKALFNTLIGGFSILNSNVIVSGQQDSEKETDWETLSKGMSGDRVTALQKALLKHGIKIDIDGHFGEDTYTKVKSFQSLRGLSVDGIVGVITASELGLI